MNCVFGPYKIISSSFPEATGLTFLDPTKKRRIAIIDSCDEDIAAPCSGAIALGQVNCENSTCNIRWYECPDLGRTYTIIASPCGVTITSFEDGLLASGSCSATLLGANTFCFGKAYSSAGEFETGNAGTVSFEFDGHSFTVMGTPGECSEIFDCGPCGSSFESGVTSFATIPPPPPESETIGTEDEDDPSSGELDKSPETQIIPSEDRTIWHNTPATSEGVDTNCDTEINVTSWVGAPAVAPLDAPCMSNDNPSVAVLPSGHMIIAFEERDTDGLTQIRVAILPSSVQKNIRYHRQLSRGTLINDPDSAQQTFEVYEEMVIETDSADLPIATDLNLEIGFLSGPLVGPTLGCTSGNCLYAVQSVVRSIETNNRIKHTILFTPPEPSIFLDTNNVYDVKWFLVNNVTDGDSIPPESDNVATVLDLPSHTFPPNTTDKVPVANPSIAVAKNNAMVSSEQNIFIVYQAFENNEWRVYLRQIVLGGSADTAPIYIAPYLFPDQSPVAIMGEVGTFNAPSASTIIWEEKFDTYNTDGAILETSPNWNRIATPEDFTNITQNATYVDRSIILCKESNPPFPSSGCTGDNPNATCRGVYLTHPGDCSDPDPQFFVGPWFKSMYVNTIPSEDTDGNSCLSVSMEIKFAFKHGFGIPFSPELWLLFGRPSLTSDIHEGWRLRIERQAGSSPLNNDGLFRLGCDSIPECNNQCFLFSLYNGYNAFGGSWDTRTVQSGTREDFWMRHHKVCIPQVSGNGDYDFNGWNTFTVNTWVKGRYRFFQVKLTNDLGSNTLVTFQEEDESILDITTGLNSESITFGKYHGFGFVTHELSYSAFVDYVKLTGEKEFPVQKSTFHEEFFDYNSLDAVPNPTIHLGDRRYSEPVVNAPNDWSSIGYTYGTLIGCQSNLNSRYTKSANYVALGFQSDSMILTSNENDCSFIPPGDFGLWSIVKLGVPAELRRNQTKPFNSVYSTSLYISVSRNPVGFALGDGTGSPFGSAGTWPNVWFLLRQPSSTSSWHEGWRVRTRHYDEGGVRKWRIGIYDGDSSTGIPTDTPVDEVVVVATIDTAWQNWVENSGPQPTPHTNATIDVLKVDIIDVGSSTQIDVYTGRSPASDISREKDFIEDMADGDFTLIHSFTGLAAKHFGKHYGLALMSGSPSNEFVDVSGTPLSGLDFRSPAIVDYVSLRSFSSSPTAPLGACCREIGGCDDTTESDCQSPDVWDASVLCSSKDCTAIFPTGASCRESDGACLVTTATGVPTGYGDFVGGEFTLSKNCILGDDVYRTCPQPTGACCVPDGTCTPAISKQVCQAFWGTAFKESYWAKDGDCAALSCPSEPASTGGCCLDTFSGCTAHVTSSECSDLSGTFKGVGTDCTDCVGACCHDSGCSDTYQLDCLLLAGLTTPRYFGNNTTCAGVTCSNPLGSCCFADDGLCGEMTEAACALGVFTNTTWTSGADCDPNDCPSPPGACCDPFTGFCNQRTEEDCQIKGRNFKGGPCLNGTCPPPTGACCVGDICSQLDALTCLAQDGVFFGANTQCLPNHCSLQDPYTAKSVNYKPEDLWVIKTGDDSFITRVLYHMQEDILLSNAEIVTKKGGEGSSKVDFMFLIDHSFSMSQEIAAIALAVPILAATMKGKGIDIKFGFMVFARGIGGGPIPSKKIRCNCPSTAGNFDSHIFNGLQGAQFCRDFSTNQDGTVRCPGGPSGFDEDTSDVGFTKSVELLQGALNCWCIEPGGNTSGWAAINYMWENDQWNDPDPELGWRDESTKFVFVATDAHPQECIDRNCRGTGNANADKTQAITNLLENGAILIPAVCTQDDIDSGTCTSITSGNPPTPIALDWAQQWIDVSIQTGWDGEVFSVGSDNYGEIFASLTNQIDIIIRKDNATVLERATEGDDGTFLKKAEVVISYDGDLSDLWTFNKPDFEFSEEHAPFPGTATKDLVNFPFPLASGRIYGIDPVHIQGQPTNWVSFEQEAPLHFVHPNVGQRGSSFSSPLLISSNSTRPTVLVNNRNQVIVAFENYDAGSAQIELKGTGDFHQNSITGAKGSRLHRFYTSSDFAFTHSVTLDGEGVNQLCDFVIDNSDITHVVWQSSRDGFWEIYYANSYDLFDPVRLTKVESRASMPVIEVDELGSIFVVYHDNRFGPFEIMLATKAEERVPSLLEQDAYHASMNHNFQHYTNTLPVAIRNPIESLTVQTGQLWGSKIASDFGNDSESYVYKINTFNGVPFGGADSGFGMDHIAFSLDGILYGIRIIKDNTATAKDQATLYVIDNFDGETEPTITQSPTAIGDIDLSVIGASTGEETFGRIIDMDFDNFGRLWIYLYNRSTSTIEASILQIDTSNASVLAVGKGEPFIFTSREDWGMGVSADNDFHLYGSFNGPLRSTISPYPIIVDNVDITKPKIAIFDFTLKTVCFPGINCSFPVQSVTFDANNDVLIATRDNDLYRIAENFDPILTQNSEPVFVTSLTTDSLENEGPFPIGRTASISYLQNETMAARQEGDFFHIVIHFFSNFDMLNEPFLIVDSRENLEAFVGADSIQDPYDPYKVEGMDARGIFLNQGQTGIVFFDASQFRPGFPRLSQPYNFEPNQTYFMKVFMIASNGAITETLVQNSSFSCSKCSRLGDNNFDSSGCSYSFVVINNTGQNQFYNFQLDFYADTDKTHLLKRFEATPTSEDLQFMEVDNLTAITQWTANGLLVEAADAKFIQIYPSLDTTGGFLCGINYTVQINQCLSPDDECSNFKILEPTNWDAVRATVTENISTDFVPHATFTSGKFVLTPFAIGMDMHNVSGELALTYRTTNNNLMYAVFNGKDWRCELIEPDLTNSHAGYVSLGTQSGRPSVAFTVERTNCENLLLYSRIFNGTDWVDSLMNSSAFCTLPILPITIFDETDPVTLVTTRSSRNLMHYHIGVTRTDVPPLNVIESFGFLAFIGAFTDTATINGKPHVVFWRQQQLYLGIRQGVAKSFGDDFDLFIIDDEISFSFGIDPVSLKTQLEEPGKPAIVELTNGQVAVAYIDQDGPALSGSPVVITPTKRRLNFRTFDGVIWTNVETRVGRNTYNKSLAMEMINGQPYIAYTIDKGSGICDLKVAIFNGSEFRHETVAIDIKAQDPQVDIIEFLGGAAITITASPLTIYVQRKDSLTSIDEISSQFFCECASKIFPDRMVHISEVSRWESSAHGHADTRVTESPKDSLRPTIKARISDSVVIVWEDHNPTSQCLTPPCLKAASFRNVNQDQLRGSGTKSWFDFDFGIQGQNPAVALDIYDRSAIGYERALGTQSEEGFFGTGTSANELPGSEILGRVCDFQEKTFGTSPTADGGPTGGCDISSLEDNIITVDEFVSSTIVKKIRIKDEFIQSYTYNATGMLTAIVPVCDVVLEIHGTPEIVAIRLKNENELNFGPWCPWSPEIGDFMMEKRHRLSGKSGVKEVCIQAMTYSGVTVQFCTPIIADYESVVFETRFYKNTFGDTPTSFAALNGENFTTIDDNLVELPLSEGLSVANLAPQAGDISPSDIVILLEIIPNKELDAETSSINYDLLQQGTDDTSNLEAFKGKNNAGKTSFRGFFTIRREDKVLNVDGLARVNPQFPNSCDESSVSGGGGDGEGSLFEPDPFNKIIRETDVIITEEVDTLKDFRQDISGRVGVDIDIRSSEDPYFVFGDPNYSLQQRDPKRDGVPSDVTADIFGFIGIGPENLCFGIICPEGERCDSSDGLCKPTITPGA